MAGRTRCPTPAQARPQAVSGAGEGYLFGRAIVPVAVPGVRPAKRIAAVLEDQREEQILRPRQAVVGLIRIVVEPLAIRHKPGITGRVPDREVGIATVAAGLGQIQAGELGAAAERAVNQLERGMGADVFQVDAPIFQRRLLKRAIGGHRPHCFRMGDGHGFGGREWFSPGHDGAVRAAVVLFINRR